MLKDLVGCVALFGVYHQQPAHQIFGSCWNDRKMEKWDGCRWFGGIFLFHTGNKDTNICASDKCWTRGPLALRTICHDGNFPHPCYWLGATEHLKFSWCNWWTEFFLHFLLIHWHLNSNSPMKLPGYHVRHRIVRSGPPLPPMALSSPRGHMEAMYHTYTYFKCVNQGKDFNWKGQKGGGPHKLLLH